MKTTKVILCIPLVLLIGCTGPDYENNPPGVIADEIEAAQDPADSTSGQLLQQILKNNPTAVSENTRQIMLVTNSSPEAVPVVIGAFEEQGGSWQAVFEEMTGSGARNGFAPFDEKAEGDGRAPTGIFDIRETFGYGESVTTRMPYRQTTSRDFWIDDVNSDNYNRWVRLEEGQLPDGSHERMKRDDHLYEHGIVISYNVEPIVKAKGSAIFIHVERAPGIPTVGCIATSVDNLLALLKWLDPDQHPIIIMGTQHELVTAELR